MDQTPSPFVSDDGKTVWWKSVKEVWAQSGLYGPDERQVTTQLTVFADGVDSVRPTVNFRGECHWISAKDKQSYSQQFKVMYQEKASCDQEIMREWISTEGANPFKNPISQNSDGKFLIADVHRAQQTDSVKELLKKHKTSLVNIPPGCTSRVQVVDVLINKPFKDEVRSLLEYHLDKNFDQHVEVRQMQASRESLWWVGEACSKVGKMKDSIISYFKKCGLPVALDGSENDEVNIEGLPEYQMPSAFVEDNEHVLDDDDESEKEYEDKGNVENEEKLEILIHSDLPIVTEWYSFENRIKHNKE